MDTLTKSCSPTIVITANGEVQTHEEGTVYVKELDIFFTMKVLLSLGRTVLHDKRHWRVLTICRTSGLSWVHFAKRWTMIRSEMLDLREHQNWARVKKSQPATVEIRIESVNKDNSHSWVRISHGLNKLVTELVDKKNHDNEQETSETKTNLAYPVAKRLNTLLRHGQLPRKEDGAVEFWILKDDLRNDFENSQHWSDETWKSTMEKRRGKIFQYCTDPSKQEISNLRALQGRSGRKPIDPTLQDNVLIPNNFSEYIYHIRCAISLHSTNAGLIAVGQNSRKKKQTVFFTAVNPMDKDQRDPYEIDLTAPLLHGTNRRNGKDTWIRCIGSKNSLLNEKDSSSIIQDVMRSSFTIHYQLIVPRKLLWWNLEKSYTRKYMCHLGLLQRFLSKTIGWQNWIPNYEEREDPWVNKNPPRRSKKMSCLVAKVPNTQHERRDPWMDQNPSRIVSMLVQIVDKYEDEDQTRTKRPVGGQHFTQLEEIDIDFSVPGLSRAVMKSENIRVQELLI